MSFGDRHAPLCIAKALDDARTGRLLESIQGLIVLAWWMGDQGDDHAILHSYWVDYLGVM